MKIKTNLSWNTLARYSALLWNNGKEDYIANGDNLVEMIEDEDNENFVLTSDYLKTDCEWHIEGFYEMLEDDFISACHQDFKDGCRDDETVKGHKEYLKQRAMINKFKRDFNSWLESVEEVQEWEFDTDEVDFIFFPKEAKGKAVAILH